MNYPNHVYIAEFEKAQDAVFELITALRRALKATDDDDNVILNDHLWEGKEIEDLIDSLQKAESNIGMLNTVIKKGATA